MGTDDGLILIRVIETLHVVKIGDVESSDVVSKSDGEVGELSIVADITVDGNTVLGLVPEIVEKFSNTLVTLGVLAMRVNDPNLTRANSTVHSVSQLTSINEQELHLRGQSSAFLVTGDEFDVLNTLALYRRLDCSFDREYLALTSGMVMVEMILRLERSQRRRVSAL